VSELVIHIGPHKTGTTTIQEALMAGALTPDQPAASYGPEAGVSAHHVLAEHLLRLDGRGRLDDAWFLADGATPNPASFPSSGGERVLISAEALCEIGPKGYDALVQWAKPDRITVIAAIRPPAAWFWSAWQQTCKTPEWLEWNDFLLDQRGAGRFFPTRYLSIWGSSRVPTQIHVLRADRDDLVRSFAVAAGFSPLKQGTILPRHNLGLGPEEAVMTALFTQNLAARVKDEAPQHGLIPSAFVARYCLDLVDNGRPCRDHLGVLLRARWRDVLFERRSALHESVLASWRDDCRRAASLPALTDGSRAVLAGLAEERPPDSGRGQLGKDLFPPRLAAIPFDGRLTVAVRACAAQVRAQHRSIRLHVRRA
jgi:hypothetical protein